MRRIIINNRRSRPWWPDSSNLVSGKTGAVQALICERHVGAGISADEICSKRLPLPKRNLLPVTIEEQIICYADKFFSKSKNRRDSAKSPRMILRHLAQHGDGQVSRFQAWMQMFG